MKKLWRTVKNVVTFAIQATHPIADHIIVDKVLIRINHTQAYKQQYLEFKSLPDQSYALLRTPFTSAKCNRQEVEDEAAQHGYGCNSQEAAEINMQESLTNLAAVITESGNNDTTSMANGSS